ncbi:MAG TPA: succinylglutamate desuccinylase [bacterium]|nr:succinylglutamate desuccinylase [bacterium]
MKKNNIRAISFLLLTLALSFFAARQFLLMLQPELIIPSENLTQKNLLSDYFKPLHGTRGDSDVYIFESTNPGANVLILGGTHANEPAGFLAAVALIENMNVTQGKVVVIPRANNSAFTCNDPQEGNPQKFSITTSSGKRYFRFGSRSTNPIDQWPDPEVYRHFPSGQKLSGAETRNLNRSYPGKADGSLTEKIAHAITCVIKNENIDIAFDLHEASLEYPVINAIVAHPNSFEMAGECVMELQMEGLNFNLEPSPENLRGLSHREWGDHLQVAAILMETANPVQGRYHGKLTPDVIVSGKDKIYAEAAQHNLLEVEYPEQGIPLNHRVGRHLAGLKTFLTVWALHNPEKNIAIENIPTFDQLLENGLGFYLN